MKTLYPQARLPQLPQRQSAPGVAEQVVPVELKLGAFLSLPVDSHERGYEPHEDDNGVILLRNCPFHQLAQQNRGVVCTMNLSLVEGLLAGLDTNDFSPSLEIEPDRCCVVLRPHTQRKASQSKPARSVRSRGGGSSTHTRIGEQHK